MNNSQANNCKQQNEHMEIRSSSLGLLGKAYDMTLALIVSACSDLLGQQGGLMGQISVP